MPVAFSHWLLQFTQSYQLQPQYPKRAAALLGTGAKVTSASQVQAPDSPLPSLVLVLVATVAKGTTAWPTPPPSTRSPRDQAVALRDMEVRATIAYLAGN